MHMAPQLLADPRARHTTRHHRSRQDSVHKTRVKVQGSSQAGQQHLSAAPGTTSSTHLAQAELDSPAVQDLQLPHLHCSRLSLSAGAPCCRQRRQGCSGSGTAAAKQTWTVLGPRIQCAIARMVRSSSCSSCGLDRMSNAKESSILPVMTPPKFLCSCVPGRSLADSIARCQGRVRLSGHGAECRLDAEAPQHSTAQHSTACRATKHLHSGLCPASADEDVQQADNRSV